MADFGSATGLGKTLFRCEKLSLAFKLISHEISEFYGDIDKDDMAGCIASIG